MIVRDRWRKHRYKLNQPPVVSEGLSPIAQKKLDFEEKATVFKGAGVDGHKADNRSCKSASKQLAKVKKRSRKEVAIE